MVIDEFDKYYNLILRYLSFRSRSEKEIRDYLKKKKLKSLKHLSGLELRRKLYNALARRGFSWETIKEVVDEIGKKE